MRDSEVEKAIFSDQDRCGWPVTVTDEIHKRKFEDLVQANRRIKQKDMPSVLGIPKKRVLTKCFASARQRKASF